MSSREGSPCTALSGGVGLATGRKHLGLQPLQAQHMDVETNASHCDLGADTTGVFVMPHPSIGALVM